MVGAATTAIAGSFPEHMVGSYAFSFFAAFIMLSLAISFGRRPRVTVSRTAPARVMAGATAEVNFRLANPARRAALDVGAYEYRLRGVRIEEEPSYIERLEPGESAAQTLTIRAEKRGVYTLPGPSAVSAFPFGLTHALKFHADRQSLVVYPSFKPLQRMEIAPRMTYQPGGVALASRVGEAMEFVGTREYRPGDRVRDLHPRSWARVGKPVVRQYDEEFFTRVAIVVDTFVPRVMRTTRRRTSFIDTGKPELAFVIGRDAGLLEANLSMAAAVADYLARQDYVVDLFAAGPQLYQFQSGRSIAYLDNILDILASIEPCKEDAMEVIAPSFAQQLGQTSTVVLLLMAWDERRSRFVQMIQDAGVPTRVVVISDDAAQAEAARAAGALHLRVEDVQRGVEVI